MLKQVFQCQCNFYAAVCWERVDGYVYMYRYINKKSHGDTTQIIHFGSCDISQSYKIESGILYDQTSLWKKKEKNWTLFIFIFKIFNIGEHFCKIKK